MAGPSARSPLPRSAVVTSTNPLPSHHPPQRLSTLLGATLEACVHEILYVRSVYPRDSFAPSRHLGVSCHASRHPGVVDYVYDALSVAVPSLVRGVADEIALVVMDARGGSEGGAGRTPSSSQSNVERVLERYIFSFDVGGMGQAASTLSEERGSGDRSEIGRLVGDLERGMRDVLLRIIAMDGADLGTRRGRLSGTTSFKLCLHVAPDNNSDERGEERRGTDQDKERKNVDSPDICCAELDEAIKKGAWFRPDAQSCSFSSYGNFARDKITRKDPGGLTRPLKSVNVPSCGLRMQLLMEVGGS
uniref:HORMA domain-containing protein n=1 Tax=Trieres chinensis TaxID=1514140 RepID=A0A7S2A333_TRICV|mmetsp:Transcript_38701/g.78956  ORF Transcript_38701/g.78956 Transcript_38701/m.78956 type:complete len:304 (+) Transcript_38701:13-924(+)